MHTSSPEKKLRHSIYVDSIYSKRYAILFRSSKRSHRSVSTLIRNNHLNGDNSKPNNGAEETINNYNRKNGKRAKKKLLFLTTLKG